MKQDFEEATKWTRLAADQGYSAAQHNLGVSYYFGRGMVRDVVLAHMWFTLAATQGQKLSVKILVTIEYLMTKDQIAEAQRLAREWKPKEK